MIYSYLCPQCPLSFDVVKTVSEMERKEECPNCNGLSHRQFVPQNLYLSGTKVEHPEYNPAFGQVVKNKYHRSELAKKHDMVEIGNDYKDPNSIHKEMDQAREEKREKAWEKVEI